MAGAKGRSGARRDALAAGLLLSLAGAAAADDPVAGPPSASGPSALERHRVEPVVVTTSRKPGPRDLAPGSLTVLDRDRIETQRYDNVTDLLRHVPGVHVDEPGGRGGRSSIYLRGLDPNHTVVLIDGVRVNDPTNSLGGSFDLSTLDTVDVERIEVVRGPLSSVYGSDAIAGAVHVVTRSGEGPPGLSLDASGGRFGTYRLAASGRAGKGPLHVSLGGAFADDGDLDFRDEYRGGSARGVLDVDLPRDARLRGTLRYARTLQRSFPDASGGPKFSVLRGLETRKPTELGTGLELFQQLTERVEYSLRGTFARRSEQRRSPGVAPSMGDPGLPAERSRDLLHRYTLEARATLWATEDLAVTLGGDAVWEDGRTDSELDFGGFATPADFDESRFVGSPYAEVLWVGPAGLVLQAALRGDVPDSDEDAEVSPRVAAAWKVPGTPVTLSASWGEGFKLPSFYALGNPLVGNDDLRSEESRGFDVGASASLFEDRVTASATFFQLTVEDLIDFDAELFRLVNRSKVVSRGVEAELRVFPHETLEIGGHLTFTDTDIRNDPSELLDRPRWRSGVDLLWRPVDSVRLGLRALFVGKVRDFSIPTGERRLDGYQRVDLSASWRADERVTLYLEVSNLLDQDYAERIGFPAVGIQPRAGIEVRLF